MNNEKREIEYFFKDLNFNEEKHIYTVGDKKLPSVSKLIKNFHSQFDVYSNSLRVSKKLGVTQDKIIKQWDDIKEESCIRGTRVHNFAENYSFNRTLSPQCNQEKAVLNFWKTIPKYVSIISTEIKMYHKVYNYAGTLDALFFNKKDSTYHIIDYKTNKDIFKNFNGQTLFEPFNDLLDSPYSKYTLQLSFYKILLEQIGLKIASLKLVWLRQDSNFEIYDLKDVSSILIKYLDSKNDTIGNNTKNPIPI